MITAGELHRYVALVAMDKDFLVQYIVEESSLFSDWHWFQYHFQFYQWGQEHPFAARIVEACLECEKEMKGFAKSFLDKTFSISGRKKYQPHYEQLMQALAELLVIRQMVAFEWSETPEFTYEPSPEGFDKNPELSIEFDEYEVGVEVKCPSLLEHSEERSRKPFQIPARSLARESLNSILGGEESENVILPRDNPVKDFLISSDDKFLPFKKKEKQFYGVLAIVWDDFIFEPISALISTSSGLFTQRSFACDEDGEPLKFENVSGVVMIRHLHQFVRAAGERPLLDSKRHVLDYGKDGEFPPKAFVPNPYAEDVPQEVLDSFQAYLPSPEMGAEYQPIDVISWFDS